MSEGEKVGFEIDFLPVGNGDRSGDAIAMRFGTPGNYKVLVYDGGTKESGQELVDHIAKYYNTTRVDYVINSHPDADHASGLSVVLEQMEVGELWMHRPWNYSSIILDYFQDGRITDNSLAERLKGKMAAAYALEQLAEDLDIPIYEPFRGTTIGGFHVLSPEKDWYIHDLIAEFQKSPEQKQTAELAGLAELILRELEKTAQKAASWISELWNGESLREDVETSAENESSVILYGHTDDRGILLTGDAGIRALNAAAEYAEANGTSLPNTLKFIQVPHHGSRNNVSTTVLDRIVGLRKNEDDGNVTKTAFVSASRESSTHPRKAVLNAFTRRGIQVFATQGQKKWHRHNMPERGDYQNIAPMEFFYEVEEWD